MVHADNFGKRRKRTQPVQLMSADNVQGDPEDGQTLGVAMRQEWRAHDADTNMVSTLHKHAALPSLMRHTPPAHLPSEVVMGMRDAACKLFQVCPMSTIHRAWTSTMPSVGRLPAGLCLTI